MIPRAVDVCLKLKSYSSIGGHKRAQYSLFLEMGVGYLGE